MKILRTIILSIATLLLIFLGVRNVVIPIIELTKKEPIIVEPELRKVWGLTIDTLKIDTLKIRPNQNISDILCMNGISCSVVDNIVKESVGIFDFRKIKSGNICYLVSCKEDSLPSYFIYEENPVDYYKFDLKDTIKIERGQKEYELKRVLFSGEIRTSLWDTFVEQGADPLLAVELSDIFAWTVDFFGIQKGDRFKALYDIKYVEDKPIGIGKIYAASYESGNDSIFTCYFEKNGQAGYFDEKGNSLKKAFLKAPLNYSRISSHFSNNRLHPVLKIHRPHHGVDYAAPAGTPVFSIGDGVVVRKAFQSGGGGNYLNIKHNSVYISQYMHLSKFASGIQEGSRVKQGQLIGYVGSTGLSSGPHLDFRIFQNNLPVNPLKVNAPPVEPISKENFQQFTVLRDSLKAELNNQVLTPALKNILASK